MVVFLADSYAIIEYFKGNKEYSKYFEKQNIITTKLNLMEVYYSALVESSKENADKYFEVFLPKCVEIGDSTIKKAMDFRHKNRKKRLSYVDAICYQLSKEIDVKFLTGDKEFKNMKNVEFVK